MGRRLPQIPASESAMGKRLGRFLFALFALGASVGIAGASGASEPQDTEGPAPPPLYELRAWTLEGGGGEALGGAYGVRGSMGQPEPYFSQGGSFRLQGGFLPGRASGGHIFENGFESGDTGAWSTTVGGS